MITRIKAFLLAIELSEFRKNRGEFYLQLANSIKKRERFRTFLLEELKIANNRSTRDRSRQKALEIMLEKLGKGQEFRFSQILGAVMPPSDRLLLSAVDTSKDKTATLRALVDALAEQKKASSLLVKALIPPVILLPGVFTFCYVLATQSIPVIVQIAPPEVWTPFNMAVRRTAEGFASYGPYVLSGLALATVFFTYQLPRWHGKWRGRLEKIPQKLALVLFPVMPFLLPLGIYRDFQVSQLLTSLAVLLRSGSSLTGALETMRRDAQPWMRWHLRRVGKHLYVAPTEYVNAFASGLLSPRLLARLATTIRGSNKFDEVLIDLGTTGAEEIRKEIEVTSKSLNSVLMIVSSALAVFLYVGQLTIGQTLTDVLDPVRQMQKY